MKTNLPLPEYNNWMKTLMGRHNNDNTGVEMTPEGKLRLGCWCWRGEFDTYGEAYGFMAEKYECGLRGPVGFVYTPRPAAQIVEFPR